MRISDWSSDVCSSDLAVVVIVEKRVFQQQAVPSLPVDNRACGLTVGGIGILAIQCRVVDEATGMAQVADDACGKTVLHDRHIDGDALVIARRAVRSEEHTSELQSLMRISYAVFCLKKKNTTTKKN